MHATTNQVRRRRQVEILKAARLCLDCWAPLSETDGNLCPKCAKKKRERQREHMRKMRPIWKALGLCLTCHGKRLAVPGTDRCGYCADWQTEYDLKRRCRQPQHPQKETS